MAKREFIDKKKAENITWQEPYYHDPINVCSEIRDKIRELPTFPEQDIVKPYLDKIRAEIEQLRLHKAEFLTSDNKVCIDSQAVLDIIDKYKGESEEV